jgi:hypothetical protein
MTQNLIVTKTVRPFWLQSYYFIKHQAISQNECTQHFNNIAIQKCNILIILRLWITTSIIILKYNIYQILYFYIVILMKYHISKIIISLKYVILPKIFQLGWRFIRRSRKGMNHEEPKSLRDMRSQAAILTRRDLHLLNYPLVSEFFFYKNFKGYFSQTGLAFLLYRWTRSQLIWQVVISCVLLSQGGEGKRKEERNKTWTAIDNNGSEGPRVAGFQAEEACLVFEEKMNFYFYFGRGKDERSISSSIIIQKWYQLSIQ